MTVLPNEAVKVIEATEDVEAAEVTETAEVLRSGKSLPRTSESSCSPYVFTKKRIRISYFYPKQF